MNMYNNLYKLIFEAHGTYIGSIRLEAHKPTQLAPDSTFHFGASTRHYVMRQRPQGTSRNIIEQLEKGDKTEGAAMLGLPESETELDVRIFHYFF